MWLDVLAGVWSGIVGCVGLVGERYVFGDFELCWLGHWVGELLEKCGGW